MDNKEVDNKDIRILTFPFPGTNLRVSFIVSPNGVDPSGLSRVCQAMLEALIKVAGQMRNEFDTYDAVSHSECPGQSELRDLRYRIDTLRDSVRNIGNVYGSLNCYQEAMNDLAMEARLRDLKIILDSTSQVTDYVPGAGQIVSRVAGGLSAGIDIYQGNYLDGVLGLTGSLIPGGNGSGKKASASLDITDDLTKKLAHSPPPNMSPPNVGRSGAFNEAKRQNGIPTSQQPSRVGPNYDRRDNIQPGRTYEFDVPTEGGGWTTKTLRDDAAGHHYGVGDPQNRGPHFNDEAGNHYDY